MRSNLRAVPGIGVENGFGRNEPPIRPVPAVNLDSHGNHVEEVVGTHRNVIADGRQVGDAMVLAGWRGGGTS